ncbi:alpha,alpha-trehalase TreF [Variovorax sp. PvP013]|uniref:alpha,alpha-trehalase TreF n=1 Tax=Variovorax sp. PvP013 TaxID=3156435 RepID=UPI003D20F90F
MQQRTPSDATARHAAATAAPPADTHSPADRYAELFVAVQRSDVFDDSKTFVDCAPRQAPEAILAAYRAQCRAPGFDLRAFVHAHFAPEHRAAQHREGVAPGLPIAAHIDALWDELTRHPARHPRRGSLLALPHAYVVPGGRFVEMYYWDSYFTMLGLSASGRHALLHAMTDNFAYLIDTHGHVPNGTRTYYLSRSQPPVFALMAELCESQRGCGAGRYLPQMRREHAYWMDGADGLEPGTAHRRVVRLPDGALLNRYWDDRDTPREESWREDVATAARSDRPKAQVWRDLRAAAESGWDFGSRWLDEAAAADASPADALATIRTTSILPVDLNALMHRLESTIARLSRAAGDGATARAFEDRAEARRRAMTAVFWCAETGAFLDHDWTTGTARRHLNAATVAPLFTRTATPDQANALATTVRRRLLAPGGFATSEVESGQQWDRPNGWAPLQWLAVKGFEAYGHHDLARDIRARWLDTVEQVYAKEGKLVEKYALRDSAHEAPCGGGGGEYPLQDGFGWTNGVVRNWLEGRRAADSTLDTGDESPRPAN